MKPVEISENSWHYKWVRFTRKLWNMDTLPYSFCSYFWSLVFSPLMALVNRYTLMTLLGAILFYLLADIVTATGVLGVLKFLAFIMGLALGFVVLLIIIEGTSSLLGPGIKSIKNKYCPLIHYTKKGENS